MDHFTYRDGQLYAEDVPLVEIAAAVGTPVYIYSRATLERHARVFKQALAGLPRAHIAFAVKANPNLAVLKVMAREGLGADVVSGGELARALAAGMPAADVVFSGVGKTALEMTQGLASSWRKSQRRAASVRRQRCGSTPMSTRAPMPRSRPARPKTSSACRLIGRRRSMPGWRRCRASKCVALPCISAAS